MKTMNCICILFEVFNNGFIDVTIPFQGSLFSYAPFYLINGVYYYTLKMFGFFLENPYILLRNKHIRRFTGGWIGDEQILLRFDYKQVVIIFVCKRLRFYVHAQNQIM